MPLTPTGEIVAGAARSGVGAGSFNVIGLEHAKAIAAGAEAARAPVILQISENTARFHGGLAAVGAGALAIAAEAAVPVAVHLDHATGRELVMEAVALGFGSVMFDAAHLDYDENVAATAEMVVACHAEGVWLEAELGEVGGKEGAAAAGGHTDPAQAAAFVEATRVDALAVAVGSSHQMVTRDATLNFDLIARLRAAVPVPLVLHGSSGVADADMQTAVRRGMTKINVATHLNNAFTRAVRERLAAGPDLVDPRPYLGAGRDAVAREVARLLEVLGAAGTAAPSTDLRSAAREGG